MKRYLSMNLLFLSLGVLALAMSVPQVALAEDGCSECLVRYSANHRTHCTPGLADPCELVTNLPPNLPASGNPPGTGGLTIYDKDFLARATDNTIYVTFSGTGDTHFGARLQLAALLDGVACAPGGNPVGAAPPGWVTLSRHADHPELAFGGDGSGGSGDLHDNSIHYTWCCPVPPVVGDDDDGDRVLRNVVINLASRPVPASDPPANAFVEGVFLFIDGNRIAGSNRCTDIDPTGGVGGP